MTFPGGLATRASATAVAAGLPPPASAAEAFADVIAFGEDDEFRAALDAVATNTTTPPGQRPTMSDLRSTIKERNAANLPTELVHLPVADVDVLMKGLMLGDQLRVNKVGQTDSGRQTLLTIAIAAFDPTTGRQIWNPNNGNDLTEIGGLHPEDAGMLIQTAARLSNPKKTTAADEDALAHVEAIVAAGTFEETATIGALLDELRRRIEEGDEGKAGSRKRSSSTSCPSDSEFPWESSETV